jgi:hypothetical protein
MLELGVVIAVLVGLGQVAKQLGLPAKYIPLMSLILGVAYGVLGGVPETTILEEIVVGAMVGLSASGLYDQSKIVTKKSE